MCIADMSGFWGQIWARAGQLGEALVALGGFGQNVAVPARAN
ncbi:hypothetical protein Z950_3381 [Sulfitobacter mediterraneus KCTC 32188]|nr:hypothetical protein Z950_3381 [Sulfitobacter mediterraneus KCTC 32188]